MRCDGRADEQRSCKSLEIPGQLRKQACVERQVPIRYAGLRTTKFGTVASQWQIQAAEEGHVVTKAILGDELQERTRVIDIRNKRGRNHP